MDKLASQGTIADAALAAHADSEAEASTTFAARAKALSREITLSEEELLEDLLDRVDAVAAMATALDELNTVLRQKGAIVRGHKCPRCDHLPGEPHTLGTCRDRARMAEALDILTRLDESLPAA